VSDWSGNPFPTKKSFLEAVRARCGFKVRILSLGQERTVFFNQFEGEPMVPVKNEVGVWYVCGPVAESDRKWYAEVSVLHDGTMKVS